MRRFLGAYTAFHQGCDGGRGSPGEPVREQCHHRQGGNPPIALRQPVHARNRCLCLFGSRPRGVRPPILPGTGMPQSSNAATGWRRQQRFPRESALVTCGCGHGPHHGKSACASTPSATVPGKKRAQAAFFRSIPLRLDAPSQPVPLQRAIERFPFVPSDPARLREDCYEAYNIQVQGLASGSRQPASSAPSSASPAGWIQRRR